ncbi:hypothetical protein E2320_009525, partial [Naja naja]
VVLLGQSYFWISCLVLAGFITLQVCGQGSNRLKLTVLSEDRLQMKWKESEGNTSGYKVRVKPMAGDSEQEVMLKTKMAKATVGGLSPTKEYTLQIYILNGSQEALFVKRKFVRRKRQNTLPFKTDDYMLNAEPTLTLPTLPSVIEFEGDYLARRKTTSDSFRKVSHFHCDTSAATDIILLVDGSWSIGRNNFGLIREFLATLLAPFNIAEDKIRVVQQRPTDRMGSEYIFHLGTGLALTHVLEHNLKEEAGVKNADETELRQVASEPLEMTVYNVVDFPLLRDPMKTMSVKSGVHLSPTNLLLKEVTSRSMHLIWNSPLITPQRYRVVYYPSRGGIPKEISHNSIKLMWEPVEGATQYLILSSSTPNGAEDDTKELKVEQPEVWIRGLTPSTEYSLAVYAMYGEDASNPASIQETTSSQAMKSHRVMYSSSRGSNIGEVEVPGNASFAVLKPLSSLTQYFVRVPPPSQLKVTELSRSEVQLEWEASAASDVVLYQIKWNVLGEDMEREISVPGNLASSVLPGLKENTEYKISIWAYYKDGAQSDTISIWHRICK